MRDWKYVPRLVEVCWYGHNMLGVGVCVNATHGSEGANAQVLSRSGFWPPVSSKKPKSLDPAGTALARRVKLYVVGSIASRRLS